jgi:hypothetical protein
MRRRGMTAQGVAFAVFLAVVEVAWIASLDFLLERLGVIGLCGGLILALGFMVAVLDATPVGSDRPDRLNIP